MLSKRDIRSIKEYAKTQQLTVEEFREDIYRFFLDDNKSYLEIWLIKGFHPVWACSDSQHVGLPNIENTKLLLKIYATCVAGERTKGNK